MNCKMFLIPVIAMSAFIACGNQSASRSTAPATAVAAQPAAQSSMNADTQWYHISSVPNQLTVGPFRFIVKKLKVLPLSDKQKGKLGFTGTDSTKKLALEVEYEVKNTSGSKQEIKGLFRFPVLYSRETGKYASFENNAVLSYGGYYMEGYMKGNATAKTEYNAVTGSANNLSNPYEAGETKTVRFFIYLVPAAAKHFIFWVSATGCSTCPLQLKTNDGGGCDIKL